MQVETTMKYDYTPIIMSSIGMLPPPNTDKDAE